MEFIYLFSLIFFPLLLVAAIPVKIERKKSVINSDVRRNSPGRFIKLSQGYTHYEVSGDYDKPVVLFIHGFSVPYYMWDKTFLPVADAGYRVVRFDMYGRGLSDRPKAVYDEKFFIRQIVELLDGLEITDKINIIGTSMGGAITAAFAASYPEYVNKVVLIDPVYTSLNISLLRFPILGELIAYLFKIPRFPEKQMSDFFRPEKFQEWPGLYKEQMKYRGFGRTILSTLRHFLTIDPTGYYESLKLNDKKVFLIWGKEDKVTPVEGAAKLSRILSSELLLLEEAGHLPHYETPDRVNLAIIEFLNNYYKPVIRSSLQ